MAVGLGILLIVTGAILAFAVDVSVSGVDLQLVGYILIGAGALAVILSLVTNQQRTHTEHRQVVDRRDVGGTEPRREDPRHDDPRRDDPRS